MFRQFEDCRSSLALIRRTTNGQAGYTKVEQTTFIGNNAMGTGDMAAGSCVNVSLGRLFLNHCSFINNSLTST